MVRRLFIHAPNVHQGGGRALLTALLESLPQDMQIVISVDLRFPVLSVASLQLQMVKVKPTIWGRLLAEFRLWQQVESGDIVLCFGNLPPLFKLKGRTVLFLQNRNLLGRISFKGQSVRSGMKMMLERFWLASKVKYVHEFIVQTPSMKALLSRLLDGQAVPKVFPFVSNAEGYSRKSEVLVRRTKCDGNFLYVASGEPHKNHRRLIDAWVLLSKEGFFPPLILTLDRRQCAELCQWIDSKIAQFNLRISYDDNVPHFQMHQLYARAMALIYPSLTESFGLPLVEARQAGLCILASELDFVRDVIDPDESFDPQSDISIARAVKRFLSIEEHSIPILDAVGFIANVLHGSDVRHGASEVHRPL